MDDLMLGFASLPALAILISNIEEIVDRFWNLDGWASRIRTWFEGMILAAIGHAFGIGMFALNTPPEWWPQWAFNSWGFDIVLGLVCALAANFGFDRWDIVKTVLEKIKVRVPVEATKPPEPKP